MKLLPVALAAALFARAGGAWAEDIKFDEASVRAFVTAQNRAWNARDFARYYGSFDPQSLIVTIKTGGNGKTARSTRTVSEDRKEAEQFFATTHAIIRETDRIDNITIALDGWHARVHVVEEASMAVSGKTSLQRAIAEEDLEWRDGRIVATGLTETR